MRSVIMPAQVIDVEDIIVGTLTIRQILLLAVPLFGLLLMIAFLPPFMQVHDWKILLAGMAQMISILLSIRRNKVLVMDTALLYIQFKLRPRQYVHHLDQELPINNPYIREVAHVRS